MEVYFENFKFKSLEFSFFVLHYLNLLIISNHRRSIKTSIYPWIYQVLNDKFQVALCRSSSFYRIILSVEHFVFYILFLVHFCILFYNISFYFFEISILNFFKSDLLKISYNFPFFFFFLIIYVSDGSSNLVI